MLSHGNQVYGKAIILHPFTINYLISIFLGFENSSLSVSVKERDTPNPVTLQVIRTFGLRGGSRVHWKALLNGVLAIDDVGPVEGDLVFADGENRKEITFNIKSDAIPEISEV